MPPATPIPHFSFFSSSPCGMSAAALVAAPQPYPQYPIVDGTVLPQTLELAFASGQFNRVPVMSGSNHDEHRLSVAQQYDYAGNPLKDADYPAAVAAFFALPESDPGVQFIVNVAYPLSNYPPPPGVQSAPLALGALGTDVLFACPTRNAARLLSQYVPTYAYEFNDENAPLSFGLPPASFPLGSYHGSELQYLFNFLGTSAPFTADQQQLSDTMIGYWTQFAETGDPNLPDVPVWSPYSAVTDQLQSLAPPTPVVESTFDTDHKCSSLWSSF